MMTVRETAAALGVSRMSITKWLIAGKLQGKKIPAPNAFGFYWLIPESEVQRIKLEREGK